MGRYSNPEWREEVQALHDVVASIGNTCRGPTCALGRDDPDVRQRWLRGNAVRSEEAQTTGPRHRPLDVTALRRQTGNVKWARRTLQPERPRAPWWFYWRLA